MSARRSSLVIGLLVSLATSTTAQAAPPSKRPVRAEGTRRGELEFGLASVMMGVGLGLIAFGSIELVRTREHQRFCNAGNGGSGIDSCLFDPPQLGYAAVGLSWGFSAPLLIGSGLLFARGARVLASARRQSQSSIAPWWNRTGGGVSWTLRF
jgi:hypothetical protein